MSVVALFAFNRAVMLLGPKAAAAIVALVPVVVTVFAARAAPIPNLQRRRRHMRHRHRRNAGRWITGSIGEFDRDLGRKRLRKLALHPRTACSLPIKQKL